MSAGSGAAPPVEGRAWWRFIPWAHEGARVRVAFLCLGLAATLLSLPPGPLPMVVLLADVPFLALLFHRAGERWKRWAWLYGMAYFALTLRWLGQVHWLEVPAAALVLGPTYVLLGAAIRWCAKRRVPFVLAVGTAAVLEEMLRTRWMGGMPWPMRSLAFASDAELARGFGWLVTASGLLGAYALSFLAAATSAWAFGLPRWLLAQDQARRVARRRWLLGGLVPLVTLLALGAYAIDARRGFDERVASGRCVVTEQRLLAVQATIPQTLKNEAGFDAAQRLFEAHLELTAQAVAAEPAGSLFGVLWPETMVPWPVLTPELAARFPVAWRDQVGVVRRLGRDALAGQDLHAFLGVLSRLPHPDGRVHETLAGYPERDSLIHVRPARVPPRSTQMRPQPENPAWFPPWDHPQGRHDKVRLVPGGEYTPLGDQLPFLKEVRRLVSAIPELEPGATDQAPFRVVLGGPWVAGPKPEGYLELKVGTVICFDLAFPERGRQWRSDGAHVLLNPANYGWFGPTDFRSQANAMARLRAAEVGATVVMAGNTGPTGFFDPVGRVYGTFVAAEGGTLPAASVASSFRTGWVAAPVYADTVVPPYVMVGDLPWWALGVGLLALGLLRARSRPGA